MKRIKGEVDATNTNGKESSWGRKLRIKQRGGKRWIKRIQGA